MGDRIGIKESAEGRQIVGDQRSDGEASLN
jgi:hypothetical protein